MDSIFIKSLRVWLFPIIQLRPYRRWFGFYGFKFRIVGIVTTYTEEVGPFPALKIADSFSMNTGLPVAVDVSVALTAEPIRFGEIDGFPSDQLQLVAVASIVAIKAPPFLLGVMQFDGRMLVF